MHINTYENIIHIMIILLLSFTFIYIRFSFLRPHFYGPLSCFSLLICEIDIPVGSEMVLDLADNDERT